MVLYCSQDKETCALLFSGQGNMCSTVLRTRKHVLYCSQEKETGTLQTTVLKEKETGALLLMSS